MPAPAAADVSIDITDACVEARAHPIPPAPFHWNVQRMEEVIEESGYCRLRISVDAGTSSH